MQELVSILKHLAGRHEQKSHGKRGSSLNTIKLTPIKDFEYEKGLFESKVMKTADGDLVIVKPNDDPDTEGRETLAYNMAKSIGYEAIPETVDRDIDGRNSSVQKWVNEDIARDNWATYADEDDFKRQNIFDYVLLNEDRHEGNYLVDDKGRVTSIDNGLIFPDNRNKNYPADIWFSETVDQGMRRVWFEESDFKFVIDNKEKLISELEKFNSTGRYKKIDVDAFKGRLNSLEAYAKD